LISQCNPREKDGGEQGNDNGGTPEGDDDMDGEYDILPPDDHTLEFIIQTLPFYLSRADYEPTLAMQAHSLLSQKIGEGKDKLNCKISLLHEAIDLYLKVSLYIFVRININRFHRPELFFRAQPTSSSRCLHRTTDL